MADPTAFSALGDENFVSLTTFRKSGEPVSTTVWVAHDGDELIVTTEKGTGKVKRIRNNPRVELRPSSRLGKVRDDAPVVTGMATVFHDDASRAHQTEVFHKKYGFQYRIFMFIEQRGKSGGTNRVMLRIAPSDQQGQTGQAGDAGKTAQTRQTGQTDDADRSDHADRSDQADPA